MSICANKDPDFFLIESCMLGGRDALLGMGFDAYVLFRGDDTVEWLEMYLQIEST